MLEARALARQQLDHVDAQLLGALVDEREGKVHVAALARGILLGRAAGGNRHLVDGEVVVLTQGPDAVGDILAVPQLCGIHGTPFGVRSLWTL